MEKIKELFSKLTQNKKLLWAVCGGTAALIVVIAIVVALLAGGSAGMTGCTVEVKSEGGLALEGVGVYVYTDSTKAELVAFTKTDKNGIAAIAEEVPMGSVATLSDVPAGYNVEESYPITESVTKISLSTTLLSEMTEIKLGGVMFDFTVTDPDGTSYTLSELLKEKKAVVLNLWYTKCEPCKLEFPFLQQAYDQYSSDIALLAMDPDTSDDDAAISAFKAENGLTFPMLKCDAQWNNVVPNIAFPTTIIIDRFGTVGLIHIGSIDNTKTFADAFAFFTAEDYVQTSVKDINELKTEVEPSGQGTADKPLEFTGVTEFEVTVDAGQTVYCNVFRVSGMDLTVQTSNLKLGYNGTDYEPADGKVAFFIPYSTDPSAPVQLTFTNPGTASETYKVSFTSPIGSQANPYELQLGDLTAEVAEGNSQGVHYSYTANAEGKLVVTVKDSDNTGKFAIALNNLSTSTYRTLEADGVADKENKATTLSVDVKADDSIQLIVTSVLDGTTYPAATAKLNVELTTEEPTEGTEGSSGGSSSGGSSGGSSSSGSDTDGVLVNPDAPVEQFGFNDFEIEVGAGEKKLVNIIRGINKTTLKIKNKNAYVVYNGKTYTPKSSTVSVSIESEGSFTPVVLEIGNSGSETITFEVDFVFAKGSRENPYKLTDGENTIKAAKNNDQGTFYTYKADESGTLTLEIVSVDPSDVIVGISINDMQAIPTVEELEEGATSVSIELPAGAKAEIIFSTKDPDKEWKIPAAEIVINATFE